MTYPSHNDQTIKLNRIEGQIKAVKKMIEKERYCVDILMQLKAIRGAVSRVQQEILKAHLEHCVSNAISSEDIKEKDKKIREILKFLKA